MTTWAAGHPPIPGYEPIRLLGQNGSIVYVARSVRFDQPVALKVWDRELAEDSAVMIGLEHPNILGVLDAGEVDGHKYVALEYAEGIETLGMRLRRGPLPEADARRLVSVIASVLQHVREQGLAVAMLTPGDVLLGETPKLMIHPMHEAFACPEFMAPEELVAMKQATAPAIDVYRVGALMYAMLTGRSPASLKSLLAHGWQSPVPVRQINPAISNSLETICMKCLEARPLDRYGSLEELIESVDRSARFTSDPTSRPSDF